MKRTPQELALLALAIGIVGCERSPTEIEPTIDLHVGSGSLVAFEAQLPEITLTSASCDQGVCVLEFAGSGIVNIMGPVTFTNHVVEDITTSPCEDSTAELVLTGATGSITMDSDGPVCPNPSGRVGMGFISAQWDVTGGTGEFDGIVGAGITRGPIGGNGPVVHLSGTVSY